LASYVKVVDPVEQEKDFFPTWSDTTDAEFDVRRDIAEMSADIEAARLITYRSAWLSDTEGPTAQTTAALYRAKYTWLARW
jgi:alkylation response protein AidB-like acyl-CoA dehydrogenase